MVPKAETMTTIKAEIKSEPTSDEPIQKKLDLFNNWDLAVKLAETKKYGIEIKTINRALNIPYKFLSPDKLKEAVYKHMISNLRRYVPEYQGIYIAFDPKISRKDGEQNLLRCRQIIPFMAQRQAILEIKANIAVFVADIGTKLTAKITDCQPEVQNKVYPDLFKYLLNCTVADHFHIVVKSQKKIAAGEEIECIVTERGIKRSSGEPCLYGNEEKTHQLYLVREGKSEKQKVKKEEDSDQVRKRKGIELREDKNETFTYDSDEGISTPSKKKKTK